jgi:hypothetical protein
MSSRAAKGTQDRREHEGEQGAALQRMGDEIQNEPTDPPALGVAPSLATGLTDPEEENAKRSQNRFGRFSPPIALLPCAFLCPFVALQFQQMQHFAARKEEMQNEPNCQNDICE